MSRSLSATDFEVVERDYFITEPRQQQLERVLDGRAVAARHGTVGAVARDADGRVAAATSTGGMVGQADGRVGDSPIVGAGVYARDNVVAISSTGHGEAFIRGVVAYDIAARIRYTGAGLAAAVRETFEQELAQRGSTGGVIAVGGDGRIVVAHNSPAMFSARGTRPGAYAHDMTDSSGRRTCRCGTRSFSGWTSSRRPRGRWRAPCSPAIRRRGSRAPPRWRRRRGRASQPCCACLTGSGSAAIPSSSSACAPRSPAP